MTKSSLRTSISKVTEDDIIVRGRRLASDLVGRASFTDVLFLHMMGREPSERESRLLSSLMVTSMDHGINQPVLVARLTYGAAPEAIQGAIAAGILGVGSVGDGAIELVAELLYQTARDADENKLSDSEAADNVVNHYRRQRKFIPGLGHPMHKSHDPRTTRLFELADELGYRGRYLGLMEVISAKASSAYERDLPLNGAAAVGSLYCELGVPARIAKAISIVALSAGVAGHLMEEMVKPMARGIRRTVANAIEFEEADSASK